MSLRLLNRARGLIPFRVTADLTEPIVYAGDLMHLDGILAAAAYRDLDDRTRRRIPPLTAPWVIDVKIPLARWAVDIGDDPVPDGRLLWKNSDPGVREVWGWCGSAELAEWSGRGVAEVRKRPTLDQMRRYSDSPTEQINGGPRKGYDLKMPTVFARRVWWHGLGDPDKALALLRRHVGAIGKKRGHGWGTVRRWDIEELPADHDRMWLEDDGGLGRRMPRAIGISGRGSRSSIRPPYHHRSRVVDAVEPSACSAWRVCADR